MRPPLFTTAMLLSGTVLAVAAAPVVRQAASENELQPYPRISAQNLGVREFGPQTLEGFRARFVGQDPPSCRHEWCAGRLHRELPPGASNAGSPPEGTWLVRRPDSTVFDTGCRGSLGWDDKGPASCSTDFPALFGPAPTPVPEKIPARILATPEIIAQARTVCEAVERPSCGDVAPSAAPIPWGAASSRCDDLGCLVAFRGPNDSGGTPATPANLMLRATGPVCAAFVPKNGVATVAHVDLGPRDSAIDIYANTHSFRVQAAACKQISNRSCATTAEATWGPDGRLHREPRPGEIAALADIPADTPAFDAFDVEYVVNGTRDWQGPADASARFRIAFADALYRLDAVVIDDLWYVHTGGKNVEAVDHLEVLNAVGDIYAILPNSDETATVERWRHEGDTRREAFDSVLCQWKQVNPHEALDPLVPLWDIRATRIRCALPGDAPPVELRFADADHGKPESTLLRTTKFEVQEVWPPAYLPRREYGCP